MRHFKGTRVHGMDMIDSYSLKISAPLFEDCLVHLVNMSIESGKFSKYWKPQVVLPTHKKKSKEVVETTGQSVI